MQDKRSTVIYFDTERKFSPQRLVEMALAAHTTMFQDPKALQHLTQQIQVIRPSTPEELAGYLQVASHSLDARHQYACHPMHGSASRHPGQQLHSVHARPP